MNLIKGVAEFFTPVLTSSHFEEKGVLTPEEFVAAGDQLVNKCKTWRWAVGDPKLSKPYLPADKQFLITRNVPSLQRAHTYAMSDAKEEVLDATGDEGWLATHTDAPTQAMSEEAQPIEQAVQALSLSSSNTAAAPATKASEAPAAAEDEGDIPDLDDLDDFDEDGALEAQEAADDGVLRNASAEEQKVLRVQEPEDTIVRTRTYDLSITYDKYYRTPRVYLFGYDEHRQPLTPEEIMQDISADHANKTVTVESHPHLGVSHLSIHPCKHASVMKKIVDMLNDGEAASTVSVDQYMFLFLKFISSVIPTIEYDFTLSV